MSASARSTTQPAVGKPKPRSRARKPVQLRFPEKGRGGWRSGAGRKKSPHSGVSHLRRPEHCPRHPVHICHSVVQGLPSLRGELLHRVIRRCFVEARDRFKDFALVHYSIQESHLHLIVEAGNKEALSRGMQGLGIRLARRINVALRRKGRVFADRYFQRPLTAAKQVRRCLLYVLQNAERHGRERGRYMGKGPDIYSSAPYFTGWIEEVKPPEGDPPVRPPGTWLLEVGWQRYGLLSLDECPKV